MITFSELRTRRLDVKFQELSIGDEIALCHLPELAHEKSLTAFLERAVEVANAPTERHVTSPRAWSVGERLLALAHYCIHTREDGPDYAVTDASRLSDYLTMESDASAAPAAFEACGDRWVLRPLIGAAVEVLESLQGQIEMGPGFGAPESAVKALTEYPRLIGREFWIIGAMAAQLLREGEAIPDPVAEFAEYGEWLQRRIITMAALPGSGFDVLFAYYAQAMQTGQFFRIWFDEQGVIVLPKEAGAAVPPARFPVYSCIGTIALSLTGKAQRSAG